MISINKSGINLELEDDVKRYIDKKIGRLDKLVPRKARKSLHGEVKIREANNKAGNKYECEAILHLPEELIAAKESTINMFAAIDIVEAKLRTQLRKYKEMHAAIRSERRHNAIRRLRARLFSRSSD